MKTTMQNEAETRRIINAQLNKVGWEADSDNLRYSNGTSPPSLIVKAKIIPAFSERIDGTAISRRGIEINRAYSASPLDVMFYDGDAIIFADWHNLSNSGNRALRYRQIFRALPMSGYRKFGSGRRHKIEESATVRRLSA